tara:strand:+ start:889 stop:1110 length:222 start_codon:yes stop_codon:yes gene_type:complete
MIYVIYEIKGVLNIDFSKIEETNLQSLRLSIDVKKTILKFNGGTPYFLLNCKQYNHDEILTIINNPDNGWIKE